MSLEAAIISITHNRSLTQCKPWLSNSSQNRNRNRNLYWYDPLCLRVCMCTQTMEWVRRKVLPPCRRVL